MSGDGGTFSNKVHMPLPGCLLICSFGHTITFGHVGQIERVAINIPIVIVYCS
jgi:hypothetical protein